MLNIFLENPRRVVSYSIRKFGAQEPHITGLNLDPNGEYLIQLDFEDEAEIMRLLLIDNVFKNQDVEYKLLMRYMPFSRQDRLMIRKDNMRLYNLTESFSMEVIGRVLSLLIKCKQIITYDIHSSAAFDKLLPREWGHEWNKRRTLKSLDVDELISAHYQRLKKNGLDLKKADYISPDHGAIGRSVKVSLKFSDGSVHTFIKIRDKVTGDIIETRPPDFTCKLSDTCVVIDDIFDGGRTFKPVLEHLKSYYKEVYFIFTHGVFCRANNSNELGSRKWESNDLSWLNDCSGIFVINLFPSKQFLSYKDNLINLDQTIY